MSIINKYLTDHLLAFRLLIFFNGFYKWWVTFSGVRQLVCFFVNTINNGFLLRQTEVYRIIDVIFVLHLVLLYVYVVPT